MNVVEADTEPDLHPAVEGGDLAVGECESGDLEADAVSRHLERHHRFHLRGHHQDHLGGSPMMRAGDNSWKGNFSISCMRVTDHLIAGTLTKTFYPGLQTV